MIRRHIPEMKISDCKECPYYSTVIKAFNPTGWCNHPKKNDYTKAKSDVIPEDCPLPKVIADAMAKVMEELLALSPEEFKAQLGLDTEKERCSPETCGGSCQGMGWCYDALDFRGEAPDDGMEDFLP